MGILSGIGALEPEAMFFPSEIQTALKQLADRIREMDCDAEVRGKYERVARDLSYATAHPDNQPFIVYRMQTDPSWRNVIDMLSWLHFCSKVWNKRAWMEADKYDKDKVEEAYREVKELFDFIQFPWKYEPEPKRLTKGVRALPQSDSYPIAL